MSDLTAPLGPLNLELRRGCKDDAVEGGLSQFVAHWARKLAPSVEADLATRLSRIAAAFDGYPTLPPEARAALCQKTLHALGIYRDRFAAPRRPAPRPQPPPGSVQFLKGVGPKRAETLAEMGVHSVADPLRHYPARHEDRRTLPPLASLKHRDPATVRVTVTGPGQVRPTRPRAVAEVPVTDGETPANLAWFNQPYRAEQFEVGASLLVTAQAMIRPDGISLLVTDYEFLSPEDAGLSLGRIVPVYPLKAGISQRIMRSLVAQALDTADPPPAGVVPPRLLAERGLQPLADALRELHFPTDDYTRVQARGRIAYEELFTLQVALARRKRIASAPEAGAQLSACALLDEFTAALPFAPTGAQARVMAEIADDLERPAAANRLIHGDVGSGKTVCAAFALFAAARAGRQGALMAPTELLAEQHHRTLTALLGPLGIECRLLTGRMSEPDKRAARDRLATGRDLVVVGTHALFQESVAFADLAVAITDEQHRFGVRQRAGLSAKGARPNVLVMSATPIPRTLALTAYGDFDVSVVDEMPPGRTPVLTALAWGPDRRRAFETLAARVVNGQQGYIVCPLVEDNEDDDQVASAEGEYRRLQAGMFKSLRLGLLHGRMDSQESETTMRRFRRGEIEILVATTVIEVGVDVPNATVMLIQNAERFGLAQLHQLRGRVGRGEQEAICVLLTRAKTPEVIERLRVLEETTNGFVIAEEDLKRRGPGELAGTRQSGLPDLRMADLVADTQTLYKAREDAFALILDDPDLTHPEHEPLRQAIADAESQSADWSM